MSRAFNFCELLRMELGTPLISSICHSPSVTHCKIYYSYSHTLIKLCLKLHRRNPHYALSCTSHDRSKFAIKKPCLLIASPEYHKRAENLNTFHFRPVLSLGKALAARRCSASPVSGPAAAMPRFPPRPRLRRGLGTGPGSRPHD